MGIMGVAQILSPEANPEFSNHASGPRLRVTQGNLVF